MGGKYQNRVVPPPQWSWKETGDDNSEFLWKRGQKQIPEHVPTQPFQSRCHLKSGWLSKLEKQHNPKGPEQFEKEPQWTYETLVREIAVWDVRTRWGGGAQASGGMWKEDQTELNRKTSNISEI